MARSSPYLPHEDQKPLEMKRMYEYFLSFRYRVNGILLKVYLKSLGCSVGRRLKCLRLPTFKDIPKQNIEIGNNVSIGRGVIFEIPSRGKLTVGDSCTLGDYSRYSTISEIHIGRAVAIAESVSIRGSFHRVEKNQHIIDQGDIAEPIKIGDDVLLGTQTVVLMGANISTGAVIGAQSLVRKGDKVHPYGIFAGSPLKHIRDRK